MKRLQQRQERNYKEIGRLTPAFFIMNELDEFIDTRIRLYRKFGYTPYGYALVETLAYFMPVMHPRVGEVLEDLATWFKEVHLDENSNNYK